MEEFAVRPEYRTPELSLIEFRGEHRVVGFPSVVLILEQQLEGFVANGSWPSPDEFLWACEYSGGRFEISDDWGGLFIIPVNNTQTVIEDVAAALVRSELFKRVAW